MHRKVCAHIKVIYLHIIVWVFTVIMTSHQMGVGEALGVDTFCLSHFASFVGTPQSMR